MIIKPKHHNMWTILETGVVITTKELKSKFNGHIPSDYTLWIEGIRKVNNQYKPLEC